MAVHQRALERFDQAQSAVSDVRLQCLQDRRFYSVTGAQWEGPLGSQFENKPRFEFNKTHLAVIRIINEYRNNRITVDFTPKDGERNDKLADTCDGLYRADEQSSTANEAYDNAFEEAVGGGFGAWRLRACYEDEEDDENDKQRIKIEPIFDADSCVFFDTNAKRQDKADAKWAFVLTAMTHDAYIEEYGGTPSTWNKEITQVEFDWCPRDFVYVAEYYEMEEKTEVTHIFRGLDGKDVRITAAELEADPEREEVLLATGFRKVREKRIKRNRVHKYQLSGMKVEADEGIIAGRRIPIVPVYGKRWYVDGIERCHGHVRLAKDAQRLINMLLSWLGEMAARFDAEKPIVTPEQIAGHTTMWAQDNVERYPYLLLNSMTDPEGNPMPAGPIGYTKAPNVPPAMAALMQMAEQSLQDVLGNQQAGEQMQPNLSGKAVELIQNRLDMQVYIYMSNMAKAMQCSGEIWLSMMKDLIVEEGRKMKVVSDTGEIGATIMNQPAYDPDTATDYVENDISRATFDVNVSVGPSSSSRRSATVRALTGMMQVAQDPETLQVLTAMSMMNIEGEGISEANEYFRQKLIRMGVVKPTEEEAKKLAEEAASAKPDANQQYLMAAAEAETASAARARADTVETIASAEYKRAQTAKTLSEIGIEQQNQYLSAAQEINSAFQQSAQPPNIGGM